MKIKILRDNAVVPKVATPGSAGFDLHACVDHPWYLLPYTKLTVPTGLAVWIEDPKLAGMVIPRSGLAVKNGIATSNYVGLIDSDYQGELMVALQNNSDKPFRICPGDRIAQLVFVPIVTPMFEIVETFEASQRGSGGFGSTGLSLTWKDVHDS